MCAAADLEIDPAGVAGTHGLMRSVRLIPAARTAPRRARATCETMLARRKRRLSCRLARERLPEI